MKMKVNILKRDDVAYPEILKEIPSPPKQLYWVGAPIDSWLELPKVAIVGSRKASTYGQGVTTKLASELASYGVVVISGLALGIDSIAHRAALDAGGITVAVLPTGLDKIYPASHTNLAREIVAKNGTLISEHAPGAPIFKYQFATRTRIESGLADAVIVIETGIHGGSMNTARYALDQGKTVMAVPGNITSPTSAGTNSLIKSGALPITDASDILFALKIQPKKNQPGRVFNGSEQELLVYKKIQSGTTDQEQLALELNLDASGLNSALTILEINGYIRASGNGIWTPL